MVAGRVQPVAAPAAKDVVQAGERRMARVESLRAIAALGVATAHAWGFAHGYGRSAQSTFLARVVFGGGFGVFLFFALSGYLLFWPFARHYFGEGASIDLRRYAINRVVRILPLYWTAVIVLLLLQEHGGSGEQWWRFMLLCENFSGRTVATVDGSLWSLVVEVHFYLLLPLIAGALSRLCGRSRRRAALALCTMGAVSVALWQAKVSGTTSTPLWRYNLPATFFYFVPGMLLALLRLSWQERRPNWMSGMLASPTAWLAASAAVWLTIFWHYDLGALAAVASFLVVGACVLPLEASRVRDALDWKPLATIGVASYSLYVWHTRLQAHLVAWHGFPHSPVAAIGITVPLAILVALVSYRLVEEPFLRLRRRWSPASAPIAVPGAATEPELAGKVTV